MTTITAVLALVAGLATQAASAPGDRLEPGLQGQTLLSDKPGSILARPYSKGVRVIGHQAINGRDSNVQLTWLDHCAYVASTPGVFPLIDVKGDPAQLGVAVIDVKDAKNPRLVRLLRDKGAIGAAETMHAISAPGRKLLAAGAYSGGQSGRPDDKAWLNIYDVSDCANPKLLSEYAWPENVHTLTFSPDGKRLYGTQPTPMNGGLLVLDVADPSKPRFIGKFQLQRPDGKPAMIAVHEFSISPDEKRIYAALNDSAVGDINRDVPFLPPSRASFGPNGGGVYIIDNSDIAAGKPNPQMRLIASVPHGGWHSVMRARINGVPYLVGGSELGRCPGVWPKIINIADEKKPYIEGEFRLAMNQEENCPKLTPEEDKALGFIAPALGTATLHFNDVDSATDTRLGLFNFSWAGLRIVDLKDPKKPVEIGYFKPGDFCTGHVRYDPKSGHIWTLCGQSGFYVLELTPEAKAALRR